MSKFKVGDLVKVMSNKSSAGWDDSIVIGKIYKVVELDPEYRGARIYVPEMEEASNNGGCGGEWWLADSCLRVVEQQLLFNFMYDVED